MVTIFIAIFKFGIQDQGRDFYVLLYIPGKNPNETMLTRKKILTSLQKYEFSL